MTPRDLKSLFFLLIVLGCISRVPDARADALGVFASADSSINCPSPSTAIVQSGSASVSCFVAAPPVVGTLSFATGSLSNGTIGALAAIPRMEAPCNFSNTSAYCPPGGVISTLSAEAVVDVSYNYTIQNMPGGGGTIIFSGTTEGTAGVGTGGSLNFVPPNDLLLGCFSPVNVAGCGGGTSAFLTAENVSGTEQFVGGNPGDPTQLNLTACSPEVTVLGFFNAFDPGPCRQNPTPTPFQISVSFANGASNVELSMQLLVSATCSVFSPDTSLFASPSDYCEAISDFSQTVRLTGFQVFDTNGKFVSNVNLVSESGFTPPETPVQTSVPEPNTIVLLAAGVIGIGLLRRKGVSSRSAFARTRPQVLHKAPSSTRDVSCNSCRSVPLGTMTLLPRTLLPPMPAPAARGRGELCLIDTTSNAGFVCGMTVIPNAAVRRRTRGFIALDSTAGGAGFPGSKKILFCGDTL